MLERAKQTAIRALRWSERYTKTDMVYLASGGFWSIVGQMAAIVSTLALAIIVSRYFPKESYGEYKYILSIVALLGVFSLNGLGSAVFQSVAHGFEGALRDGFWKNLRWSILMFAGAFAIAAYYFFFGNHTLALGILIGGCFSPLLASANLGSSFLTAKKDFRRDAIYFGTIATVVPAGALVVTVLLTNSPLWLAAIYFISNTLSTVWAYRRTLALYRPDEKKTDPGMLAYGKHLSAMGILNTIAGNIDQILLFHFVGAAQLAIYNFAIAIPDQTKGPLKTFTTMVQARFADRPNAQIKESMRNKVFIAFLATSFFALLYAIFAPWIYHILFPAYADSALYSSIYAISLISYALAPASAYLSIRRKIKEQYWGSAVTSVVQIILMVIGVLGGGIMGLVIARVATRLFGSTYTYVLYARSVKNDEAGKISKRLPNS